MPFHAGTIEKGLGRAGALGFPTINMPLDDENISGIYAARVFIEGATYNSVVYADRRRKLLEAHIFDFSGELHAKEARVELLEKLREDEAFGDTASLRAAIADDVRKARKYFDKK